MSVAGRLRALQQRESAVRATIAQDIAATSQPCTTSVARARLNQWTRQRVRVLPAHGPQVSTCTVRGAFGLDAPGGNKCVESRPPPLYAGQHDVLEMPLRANQGNSERSLVWPYWIDARRAFGHLSGLADVSAPSWSSQSKWFRQICRRVADTALPTYLLGQVRWGERQLGNDE